MKRHWWWFRGLPRLVSISAGVGLLALILACGGKATKSTDGQTSGSGSPDTPDAPMSMTADDLTKELASEAKKKYSKRVLEVTGVVESSNEMQASKDWKVILKGVDDPKSDRMRRYKIVDCQFPPGSPAYEKAKSVKVGQKVTIRGTFYSAFDYGVRLEKCDRLEEKK